eukprot:m51a1_g10325 hypothetical protein (338) ;mRNA; f:68189-74843
MAVDLVSVEPQDNSTITVIDIDACDLKKLTDDVLVKINAVVVEEKRSTVALSETPHTVLPLAQGLVCFLPGCAVVPVGDFDRDGADDLAFVSADPTPLPDATAPTAATTLWPNVWVYFGGTLNASRPARIGGLLNKWGSDATAIGVAGTGDVDVDGLSDMIVWFHSLRSSSAYTIYGHARDPSSAAANSSSFTWTSRKFKSMHRMPLGMGVYIVFADKPGDINGDRVDDCVFAYTFAGIFSLRVYLGAPGNSVTELRLNLTQRCYGVVGVGDLDGDRMGDVALRFNDSSAQLVFGARASEQLRLFNVSDLPDMKATEVRGLGDVDGDSLDDLMLPVW